MFCAEKARSMSFVAKLIQFLSLFGITPWYNFEENVVVLPKIFKCYSTLLVLLLTSLCLRLIYDRYGIIYKTLSVEMFCDVAMTVKSLLTVSMTILRTTFWNTHIWIDLYRLDNGLSSKKFITQIENKVFILKYGKFVFALGNVCLFAVCYFNGQFLEDAGNYSNYFISTYILIYFEFLLTFVIISMTALIRRKYVSINNIFNSYSSKEVYLIQGIRKVKKLFIEMDEIIQNFNNLFGWPILMVFFDVTLLILASLVGAVTDTVTFSDKVYHISSTTIMVLISYALQSAVWLTGIIFFCDSVTEKSKELLASCYDLEQKLPWHSREREELESLKNVIKYNSPKLTAAGFFEIRRSALLSLFGTITTYFIVVLQFKSL